MAPRLVGALVDGGRVGALVGDVGTFVVGALEVGMGVGLLLVGDLDVGASVVGALLVGDLVVGEEVGFIEKSMFGFTMHFFNLACHRQLGSLTH